MKQPSSPMEASEMIKAQHFLYKTLFNFGIAVDDNKVKIVEHGKEDWSIVARGIKGMWFKWTYSKEKAWWLKLSK